MAQPVPFFREAGNGPGVVCLHANASTSGQWRSLMDCLAAGFRVLAPDLYGSGQSPDWPSREVISLHDEAALIEPVLASAGAPLTLVGHSYGAALALIVALANPGRVAALVLYEPTLFALLDAERAPPNEADGIRGAVAAASAALDRGQADSAAQHFIDYWMGPGSWAMTAESRKPAIAAAVGNVRRWAHALLSEPTPLATMRALDMPVLFMLGKRSTVSAHGVARLLLGALPRVERLEFDELGHMGPITHQDQVNPAIAHFLQRLHGG
ncbi:alpha/beta hydrolase [Pseudomonas sp.]|uniref:alpha/beta fold hydrolase n=1 Tax=Pseudomonas sp. TaxID=306 RepID=UPI002C520E8A|nr:alpha/beta hydrolase [Pseudomonas sp.]HUE92376.1 alpha/beta hydrolase [Pseudomonas sp.]